MKIEKLSGKYLSIVAFASLIGAGVALVMGQNSLAQKLHISELMSKIQPFFVSFEKPDAHQVMNTEPAAPKVEAKAPVAAVTRVAWRTGDAGVSTPKIPLNEKIVAYAVVELDQHPAQLPVAGEQVQIPMLGGKSVVVNVESITNNPNGDYTWSGHLQGYGTDYPVIMTYGEHSIFAMVTTPEGSYSMESVEGLGWLYKNPAEAELSKPGTKDYLEVN